jgi:hypothetical protein
MEAAVDRLEDSARRRPGRALGNGVGRKDEHHGDERVDGSGYAGS